MTGRKINDTVLRDLWGDPDLSVDDICDEFGATRDGVRRAARRLGLPVRPSGRPASVAKVSVAHEPAIPEGDLDPLSRAILAHGNTYAARARIAARHGLSETAVLQRFHRLRAAR